MSVPTDLGAFWLSSPSQNHSITGLRILTMDIGGQGSLTPGTPLHSWICKQSAPHA
ncbi:MAG: hypothetical protein OXE59_04930 [Bacteroidetes bacterium]|nr:hypothetical protein [Bacteroidota bacterium]MCY4233068.1 hypothetical protein [Bacteroidota bacterium]